MIKWDDNGRWLGDYIVLPFPTIEEELPSYDTIWQDLYDAWPAWYPCIIERVEPKGAKCVFDK